MHDQNQKGNSEKLSPHYILKLRSQKGVLPKHKSQVKYIALQGRGNLLQCCSYSYPPRKKKLLKVAFFQKVRCVLQISKKNYSKLLFWTWKLNFLPITVNNKFKFQAQDSNLENFYFGDLKNESHFLKKATFSWDLMNNDKFQSTDINA